MENVRAGDHPFTDILRFGRSEFGEPVDGFVRHLATLPGFSDVSGEVRAVLWEASPMGRQAQREELTSQAMDQLSRIAERLQAAEFQVQPIAALERGRQRSSPVTSMLIGLLLCIGLFLGFLASWFAAAITASDDSAFGPAVVIIGGPFFLIAWLVWRSRHR